MTSFMQIYSDDIIKLDSKEDTYSIPNNFKDVIKKTGSKINKCFIKGEMDKFFSKSKDDTNSITSKFMDAIKYVGSMTNNWLVEDGEDAFLFILYYKFQCTTADEVVRLPQTKYIHHFIITYFS